MVKGKKKTRHSNDARGMSAAKAIARRRPPSSASLPDGRAFSARGVGRSSYFAYTIYTIAVFRIPSAPSRVDPTSDLRSSIATAPTIELVANVYYILSQCPGEFGKRSNNLSNTTNDRYDVEIECATRLNPRWRDEPSMRCRSCNRASIREQLPPSLIDQ